MNKKQIRLATVGLLLANFMGGLDTTLMNVALTQIVSSMHAVNEVGLLTSILLFSIAVTTVLWGKFAELFGNKRGFIIATFIFVIASLMGALASNIWILIISRMIMGVGIGGMVSIPFIIYIDLYPKVNERATALGWVTAFYAVATILGPIIGGVLVDFFGWQAVFIINIPFGLLSIFLIHTNYKDKPQNNNKKVIDILGSILLIAILSILLFGITSINTLNSFQIIGGIIVIGVLTLLFLKVEQRAASPILPIELFVNWPYLAKSILMTLVAGLAMAYSIYAPMWAQNILHTNATLAGGTQILSSILLIVATRFAPKLFDRFSFKQIIRWGFFFSLFSALLLSFLPIYTPYWLLVIAGGFQGFGQGMIFPPAQVAFQEDVKESVVGVATTFSLLIRTFGQTILTSLFGVIYARMVTDGIQNSNGLINNAKMDHLGTMDISIVSSELLNQMEKIAYSGFHLIFLVSLCCILLGTLLNRFSWSKNN